MDRYRKLLQLVDIRDNFFFSWSYPLMHRLQRNLCKQETEHSSERTMFVWNEHLTHQTRVTLKSTLWTVPLIHGFFKQVELSTGGNTFIFTLIARRSCQFAGTRYEKRGVNSIGQAANEVEIEQIVWQRMHSDCPSQISSSVQIRGSIPLSWSQKSTVLKVKPDIEFSVGNYKGTKLHFESLRRRYEAPQIILNLLKASQIKHREYIMHHEFQNAVAFINQGLAEKDQVEFLSLDLDAAFKDEKTDEVTELKAKVAPALKKIGIFSCKMPQSVNFKAMSDLSYISCSHQKGILRANCLDSLDRTNVAQYVYGMVALGQQLHTLKLIESQELKFSDPLAYDLMNIYQAMGDALSRQYAGSPAHHKIFAKIRGQNKMATQFQELMKSIQRHYSNSFTDGTKQQAID
ncbi:Phosphoinositide phosphatase SAC2, partial [Bienertia sinuspersici]